tara:strand:- start:181 stop:456 length:276 start_codon:yes stop_codon:yes gene_type:complete
MLSKNCFESESEYIMLSKYLKDNALEDMKVELSKMKSELQKKEDKNNEIYRSEYFMSDMVIVNEALENTHDLERDILMFERFIELSESVSA